MSNGVLIALIICVTIIVITMFNNDKGDMK
jgi:hypothetical protein